MELKSSNFILYSDENGDVKVEVFPKDETLWLTQKAMAELFGVRVPAISKHLKNIFDSGELDENMVVSILEITTKHGAIKGKTQQKLTKFYNLDTIIAVGYRVNSNRATFCTTREAFRIKRQLKKPKKNIRFLTKLKK